MMNKLLRLVCFFPVFVTNVLYAGIDKGSSAPLTGTSIVANAIFSQSDIRFGFAPDGYADKTAIASVELYINQAQLSAKTINKKFGYEVDLSISFYNNLGQLINTSPLLKTLKVSYSTTTQQLEDDIDMVTMKGAYQVKATVNKVRVTEIVNEVVQVLSDPMPSFVSLRATTEVERYYDFNATIVPFAPSGLTHNYIQANNQLEIYWPYLIGAEDYELEYTYIDDYLDATGLELKYDFKNNATRVVMQGNSYKIPMIFDKGYLLYRVRGIGRTGADFSLPKVGAWSSGGAEAGLIKNFATQNKYTISKQIALIGKNWQYSADFAEEGKRRDNIAYFDGALKSKQSQTFNNTEQEVLVAETKYDYVGRGVISTLPVPVDPSDNDKKMFYKSDFTKNSDGNEYSRADFDIRTPGITKCGKINPEAMNTASGAARYYSSTNPEKSNENAYIPDANGFPFSQVEYTDDKTGRVRRQSGVGSNHKLGSKHETFMSYGTPTQTELDKMFGLDAGFNTHYQKTITKDPNGQITVQYSDMMGKTVATAMAGVKPDNLDPIYNESEFTESIEKLISEKNPYNASNPSRSNSGTISSDGKSLEYNHTLNVYKNETKFDISYELTPEKVSELTCLNNTTSIPVCYDCVYDLRLEVLTSCGDVLYTTDVSGVKVKVGTVGTTANELKNCLATSTDVTKSTTLTLEAGEYRIRRVLTVNSEALEAYTANYWEEFQNTCPIPTYQDEFDDIPNFICEDYDICDKCTKEIGYTYAEHKQLNPTGYLSLKEYYIQQKECKNSCGWDRVNDALYNMLLADVSPGGQYGCVDKDSDCFTTSVYNEYNKFGSNYYTTMGNWRKPYFNEYQQEEEDLPSITEYIPQSTAAAEINEVKERYKHYYNENGTISYLPLAVNVIVIPGDGGAWGLSNFNFSLQPQQNSSDPNLLGSTVKIYKVKYAPIEEKDGDDEILFDAGDVIESSKILINNNNLSLLANDLAEDEGFVIEPQYLASVTDFTNNWKPSWAASLVKNHPEYCYYNFRVIQCDQKVGTYTYTSEDFDAFINEYSFADIKAGGKLQIDGKDEAASLLHFTSGTFLKEAKGYNLATPNSDFPQYIFNCTSAVNNYLCTFKSINWSGKGAINYKLTSSNVHFLMKCDPFFSFSSPLAIAQGLPSDFAPNFNGVNTQKISTAFALDVYNKMMSKLMQTEQDRRNWKDIRKSTAYANRAPVSPRLKYSTLKGYENKFLIDENANDDFDYEEADWRMYVNLYLKYKNEIIKELSNRHCNSPYNLFASNQTATKLSKFKEETRNGASGISWWGSNECIENTKFNRYFNHRYSYRAYWPDKYFYNFYSDRAKPCTFWNSLLYKNKTKRYNKEDDQNFDANGCELAADVETTRKQSYVEHFKVTGQYPILRDVEYLLSNLAQSKSLIASSGSASFTTVDMTLPPKTNYVGQDLYDLLTYKQPMPFTYIDPNFETKQYKLEGEFQKTDPSGGINPSLIFNTLNVDLKNSSSSATSTVPYFGCGNISITLPKDITYSYTELRNKQSDNTTGDEYSNSRVYVIPLSFEGEKTVTPIVENDDPSNVNKFSVEDKVFKITVKNIAGLRFLSTEIRNSTTYYRFIGKAVIEVAMKETVNGVDSYKVLRSQSYGITGSTCIPIDGSNDVDLSQTCNLSEESKALVKLFNASFGTEQVSCCAVKSDIGSDANLASANAKHTYFKSEYNKVLDKYITGNITSTNVVQNLDLKTTCASGNLTGTTATNVDNQDQVDNLLSSFNLQQIQGLSAQPQCTQCGGNSGNIIGPVTPPGTIVLTPSVVTPPVVTPPSTCNLGGTAGQEMAYNGSASSFELSYGTGIQSNGTVTGSTMDIELTPIYDETIDIKSINITNIKGVTCLKPTGYPNEFTMNVWVLNGDEYVSVPFKGKMTLPAAYSNFPFNTCGPSKPSACSGAAISNRDKLELFLNDLVGNEKASTNTSLLDNAVIDITAYSTYDEVLRDKFKYQPTVASGTSDVITVVPLTTAPSNEFANRLTFDLKSTSPYIMEGKFGYLPTSGSTVLNVDSKSLQLEIKSNPDNITFSQIVGFRNLRVIDGNSIINHEGGFIVTGIYKKTNNDFGTVTVYGSISIPLQECDLGCISAGYNIFPNGDFKDPAFEPAKMVNDVLVPAKRVFDSDFGVNYGSATTTKQVYITKKVEIPSNSCTGSIESRSALTDVEAGLNHVLVIKGDGINSTTGSYTIDGKSVKKIVYKQLQLREGFQYAFSASFATPNKYRCTASGLIQHRYKVTVARALETSASGGSVPKHRLTLEMLSSKPTITEASATFAGNVSNQDDLRVQIVRNGAVSVDISPIPNNSSNISIELVTKEFGKISFPNILTTTSVLNLNTVPPSPYSIYEQAERSLTELVPNCLPCQSSNTTDVAEVFLYSKETDGTYRNLASFKTSDLTREDGWKKLLVYYPTVWEDSEIARNVEFGIAVSNLANNEIAIDNISLASECGTAEEGPEIEIDSQCEELRENIADINQANKLKDIKDKALARFKKQYLDKCLSAAENLTIGYVNPQYHYTLYYYDQVGNLSKTVPPKGVRLINDVTTLDKIVTQRNLILKTEMEGKSTHHLYDLRLLPPHEMATTYRYNSLNQLVTQALPDHETFNSFELGDPSANSNVENKLDEGLTIKDAEFFNNTTGLAIANNANNISSIYFTNDAAKDWQKVSKIGIQDINAVQFLNTTTAFAVTSQGKLLVSTDAGNKWLVYNTVTDDNLVAVNFTSASDGMIMTESGRIYITADPEYKIWKLTNGIGLLSGAVVKEVVKIAEKEYYVSLNYQNKGYLYHVKQELNIEEFTWTNVELQPAYQVNHVANIGGTTYAVGKGGLFMYKPINGDWQFDYMTYSANTVPKEVDLEKVIDLNIPNYIFVKTSNNKLRSYNLSSRKWGGYSVAFLTISEDFKVFDVNGNLLTFNSSDGTFGLSNVKKVTLTTGITLKSYDTHDANQTGVFDGVYLTSENKVYNNDGSNSTVNTSPVPILDLSTLAPDRILALGRTFEVDIPNTDPATKDQEPFVPQTQYGYNGVALKGNNVYKIYRNVVDQVAPTVIKAAGGTTLTVVRFLPTYKGGSYNNRLLPFIASDNKIYHLTYGTNIDVTEYLATEVTQLPAGVIASNVTAFDMGQGDNNIYLAVGNRVFLYDGTWTEQINYTIPRLNGISASAIQVFAASTKGVYLNYTPTPSGKALVSFAGKNDIDFQDVETNAQTSWFTYAKNVLKVENGIPSFDVLPIDANETPNFTTIKQLGNAEYLIGSPSGIYNYNITSNSLTKSNPTSSVNAISTIQASSQALVVGQDGFIARNVNATMVSSTEIDALKLCGLAISSTPSSSVVFAIGQNGTLLQSPDRGVTWNALKSSFTVDFTTVVAVSDNLVFVGAKNGKLYKWSQNGTAASFTEVSLGFDASQTYRDAIYKFGVLAFVVDKGDGNGSYVVWSKDLTTFNKAIIDPTKNMYAADASDENTLYAVGESGTIKKVILDETTATATNMVQSDASNWATATLRDVYFSDYNTGYIVGDNGTVLKTINRGASWINKSVAATTTAYKNIAPIGNNNFYLAGQNGTSPNVSLLSDYSDKISQRFWYDALGRIVASQNTKQFKFPTKGYSYTQYDALGRTYESGEVLTSQNLTGNSTVTMPNFLTWLNTTGNVRREIMRTYYTKPKFDLGITDFTQENLLVSRVASTTYQTTETNGYEAALAGDYDHAMHYTYDEHGNVNTMVAENKLMGDLTGHRFKRLDYRYDLISGKVNEFSYQKGQPDQLHHRYSYDADNRITRVNTSKDGYLWETDARYDYYRHGPLARTELGKNNVQGIDHAYTIQGWIKGVNGNTLTASRDMGKDAVASSVNHTFAPDQFGYTLGYFNSDYVTIGTFADNARFDAKAGTNVAGTDKELFNGNISHMVTAIHAIANDNTTNSLKSDRILLSGYKYDQLNRLKEVDKYSSTTLMTDNNWDAATLTTNYAERFSYDANGNITYLQRKDGSGDLMDDFTYNYHTISNKKLENTNKLLWVDDEAIASVNDEDLDDQAAGNYTYDPIGNLIKDNKEGIDRIEWNVSGKVTSVLSTTKPNLYFAYDATGQRVMKRVDYKEANNTIRSSYTFYQRDPQGNTLATYASNASTPAPTPSLRPLMLKEQNLYGSSRLGLFNADKVLPVPGALTYTPPTPPVYSASNTSHVLVQGSGSVTLTNGQVGFVLEGQVFNGTISNSPGTTLYILGTLEDMNSVQNNGMLVFNYGTYKATNLNMSGNTYHNYGRMEISGNLSVVNNTGLNNYPNAVITVQSDLTLQSSVPMVNKGTITVSNDLLINNQGQLHQYGTLTVANKTLVQSVGGLQLFGDAKVTTNTLFVENQGGILGSATSSRLSTTSLTMNSSTAQITGAFTFCNTGTQTLTNQAKIDPSVVQTCTTSTSTPVVLLADEQRITNRLGAKHYELSNHLGNVLVTITDRKMLITGETTYRADASYATDYFAFGGNLPGRSLKDGSYRYGFNGQEKTDELGLGHTTALYWEYDARLGRRWNLDPKPIAEESQYATNRNNPVQNNDPNGDCPNGDCPEAKVNVGLGLGSGGFKFNFNISIDQKIGSRFTGSYGLGVTYHSKYLSTGKSGFEFRNSFKGSYNFAAGNVSLGTNFWNGTGEMSEFKQRTGMFSFKVGQFGMSYENDGTPFQSLLFLKSGDGRDAYRTAAISASYGDVSIKTNLFTGLRDHDSYSQESSMPDGIMGTPQGRGQFGEKYTHGFVVEKDTPYRFGGLTLNYNGISLGIDSDRYVRHPVQNSFAHDWLNDQRQFPVLSGGIKPIYNFSTIRSNGFTTWD
jgi:photosystem II stability/assembly factor-like uncharacterized protein